MKMPLKVGDLVWYNVGGRGKETVGLVVETADLWRQSSPWENVAKKYTNAVRIMWMRVGKLKPRHIALPLFRNPLAMQEYTYPEGWDAFNPITSRSKTRMIPSMGTVTHGEWYEAHFFKALGGASKRRK